MNAPICSLDFSPLSPTDRERILAFIHLSLRLAEMAEILTTSPTAADLPGDCDIGAEVRRLSQEVTRA